MAKQTSPVTKKARVDGFKEKKLLSKEKPNPKHQPTPKPTQSNITTEQLSAKRKGKLKETVPKTTSKTENLAEDDHPPPSKFMVVAGSYEKLLYGLEGTTSIDDNSKLCFHLKPVFIFPAHVSCIKAVAASPHGGKWLATGSADEIVKVWDLRRRKEVGGLMHHEGSITHLTFPSRSHLLSASEDGTLCLFRARDWAVLRALKGHKGRVNSVAIHPSGKVALSVGKDKTLRMWDLMRGRGVASTKLRKEGEIVRWSVDGALLVVQSGSTIDVYTTDMALIHTIQHPSRLHDVKFCKRINGEGEILLAGAEDKKLSLYEILKDPESTPRIIAEMVGHSNRVKAVQTLGVALPASTGRLSTTLVCTISSDGKVHLYDLYDLPTSSDSKNITAITPVVEYDSKGTRLTCLAMAEVETLPTATNGKRKRDGDEDGADAEDEDAGEEDEDEKFGSELDEEGSLVEDEDEDEDEDEQELEEESE